MLRRIRICSDNFHETLPQTLSRNSIMRNNSASKPSKSSKKLYMYLVSPLERGKYSQWWMIHYSAKEAKEHIAKNWKTSPSKWRAELVDSKLIFGAPLSLNPEAHKNSKPRTVKQITGEIKTPRVFGAAGDDDFLGRVNSSGHSSQSLLIQDDGKILIPKSPLRLGDFNKNAAYFFHGQSVGIVHKKSKNPSTTRITRGEVISENNRIHAHSSKGCFFATLEYSHNLQHHALIYIDIYLFRTSTSPTPILTKEYNSLLKFLKRSLLPHSYSKINFHKLYKALFRK